MMVHVELSGSEFCNVAPNKEFAKFYWCDNQRPGRIGTMRRLYKTISKIATL